MDFFTISRRQILISHADEMRDIYDRQRAISPSRLAEETTASRLVRLLVPHNKAKLAEQRSATACLLSFVREFQLSGDESNQRFAFANKRSMFRII